MTRTPLARIVALLATALGACTAPAREPTRPQAVTVQRTAVTGPAHAVTGPGHVVTSSTQTDEALPRVTALSTSCALAEDGRIFCFGRFRSHSGATPDDVNYARAVPGITDVAMFSEDSGLCYVHRAAPERITCQARDSTSDNLGPAADYVLPEPVRELWNGCAITISSKLYCLSSRTAGRISVPPVRNFVRTLNSHCIATEDGRIGCWGQDNFVETRNERRAKAAPKDVQMMRWLDAPKGSIGAFTAGLHTSYGEDYKNALCFQSKEGKYSCENARETKGLVSWLNTNAIKEVHPLTDSVLGLAADGSLRAFHLLPRPNAEIARALGDRTIPGVVAFGATAEHACVIDQAQTLACFGVRDDGWLGNGERLSSPTPVRVDVPAPIELSSNGGEQFCTRQENGTVHCWGGFDDPKFVTGRQIAELTLPEPSAGLAGGENLCSKGKSHWWCASHFVRPARRDGFTPLKDPSGRLVPLDADLTIDAGIGIFVSTPSGERSVFYYELIPRPLVLERTGAKGEQALPRTSNCIKTTTGASACAELSGIVHWIEVPRGTEPRKLFTARTELALLTMKGELFFGSRTSTDPVRWEPTHRLARRDLGAQCCLRGGKVDLCRSRNGRGPVPRAQPIWRARRRNVRSTRRLSPRHRTRQGSRDRSRQQIRVHAR